jgi:hypothetical protein
MPRLRPLRSLTLDARPAPRLPLFVSAASALVPAGPYLYVIGDDLKHLAVFPVDSRQPGSLVRLFAGTVPAKKKRRKKLKRDLESLAWLPPFAGFPHGALLALGSGARRRRCSGALVALDARQQVTGKPALVDLARLYAPLEREFGELNIEGAFVSGPHLALLQRGLAPKPRSARVRVKLATLLEALIADRPPTAAALHDITDFELGAIEGVALGFTDGAAMRRGAFAFTAVAEATDGAYDDAACVGSAIGVIGPDDKLRNLWRLKPSLKVEGIAVEERSRAIRVLVVTDADDPKTPARLLAASLRSADGA